MGFRVSETGTWEWLTAKKALAGSEVDLLVMPIISSHHLSACSSFPWCFPLSSLQARVWIHGFPRRSASTLPQHILAPASAALPPQSLFLLSTSKQGFACACSPLPHSLPVDGLSPLLLGSAFPPLLPVKDAAHPRHFTYEASQTEAGISLCAKPHAGTQHPCCGAEAEQA